MMPHHFYGPTHQPFGALGPKPGAFISTGHILQTMRAHRMLHIPHESANREEYNGEGLRGKLTDLLCQKHQQRQGVVTVQGTQTLGLGFHPTASSPACLLFLWHE